MSWTIDKSFSACFGHRVWSQELDTNYTSKDDNQCKCRHLHGHEMLIKVFLEADRLEAGMVTDFKHLGFMSDFIDDVIDHKFLMDINDPLLAHELPDLVDSGGNLIYSFLDYNSFGDYLTIKMDNLLNIPLCVKEKYEGIVIVKFIPTSENLCKWLYDIAQEKLNGFAQVQAVEYWETPKSHSRYEPTK